MRLVSTYEREDLRHRYNDAMHGVVREMSNRGSVLRALAHLGAAVALADLAADTERERELDEDETQAVYNDERARQIKNGDDVSDWPDWEDPRREGFAEWQGHAANLRQQIEEMIAEQEALGVTAAAEGKVASLRFGPLPEVQFVTVEAAV